MDRSGAIGASAMVQPDAAASMIAGVESQQTQSMAASSDPASTGDDCVGVGGCWQQTHSPGDGQAGVC